MLYHDGTDRGFVVRGPGGDRANEPKPVDLSHPCKTMSKQGSQELKEYIQKILSTTKTSEK